MKKLGFLILKFIRKMFYKECIIFVFVLINSLFNFTPIFFSNTNTLQLTAEIITVRPKFEYEVNIL